MTNVSSHSTLRRRLVDTGCLTRSKDGSAYQPGLAAAYEFAAEIDLINLAEAIVSAREKIERRKQMFMQRSK